MKREIIYLIYQNFRSKRGEIIIAVTWSLIAVFLIPLLSFIFPLNIMIVVSATAILAFRLCLAGKKTSDEKRQFKKWEEIVQSTTATPWAKEQAAEKMMNNPEIWKDSLEIIMSHEELPSRIHLRAKKQLEEIKKKTNGYEAPNIRL